MAYRAVRNEPRMGIGEWTRDLRKGEVLQSSDLPQEVAEHLVAHGVLVEVADDAEHNEWFDSEDPNLSGGEHVDLLAQELADEVKAEAAAAGVEENVTVTVDEVEAPAAKGKK